MKVDLIIHNCNLIATMASDGRPKRGKEKNNAGIVTNGAIAIKNGKIRYIGKSDEIMNGVTSNSYVDAYGGIVTPGFVDPHTHPVFVHTREKEFAMRLAGATYVEISKAGGGINSTIETTKNADFELLLKLAKQRIRRMISMGTTTLEAKSGYGLDTESELNQLSVIGALQFSLPIDIVPTFMGAHEYPMEYKNDHAAYIKILTEEMIPAVVEQGIAKYCDIFTEAHVFNIEESRHVLLFAKAYGLKLKMHADEIEPMGGAELAAELRCTSADHLGAASEKGLIAMRNANVAAVLLPATLFSLGAKSYAKGRFMIDSGLIVALATDYNPGSCNCDSMPMVMTLACLKMGFTPIEALAASTINAAYSIGMADHKGSLEVGKDADLIIWDIPSLDFIPYHFGSSHIFKVFAKGELVHRA